MYQSLRNAWLYLRTVFIAAQRAVGGGLSMAGRSQWAYSNWGVSDGDSFINPVLKEILLQIEEKLSP